MSIHLKIKRVHSMKRLLIAHHDKTIIDIIQLYLTKIFDVIDIETIEKKALKKYENSQDEYTLVITDSPTREFQDSLIFKIKNINRKQNIFILSHEHDADTLIDLININVTEYYPLPLNIDTTMNFITNIKKLLTQDQGVKSQSEIILNQTFSYNMEKMKLFNIETQKFVHLTRLEGELLQLLMDNINAVVSLEDIELSLWNAISHSKTKVRVLLKRVKDKIAQNDFILSQKGVGYIILPKL